MEKLFSLNAQKKKGGSMDKVPFFEKQLEKPEYERTIPLCVWVNYETCRKLDNPRLNIDLGLHRMAVHDLVECCVFGGLKEISMTYSRWDAVEILTKMLDIGCEIIGTTTARYCKVRDEYLENPALLIRLPDLNFPADWEGNTDNRNLLFTRPSAAQQEVIEQEDEQQRRLSNRNAVSLIGHIEKPPLDQVTKNGLKVVRYTIQIPSKSNGKYEYAECVAYGDDAKTFPAGTLVEAHGRIKSIISKTKDGKEYRRMEVLVDELFKLEPLKQVFGTTKPKLVRR